MSEFFGLAVRTREPLTSASGANGASDARANPSGATTHQRGSQSWSRQQSILRPRRAHKFQCDLPTRRRQAPRPLGRESRYGRQNSRERELTSSCCHHLLPGPEKLGSRPAGVKRRFKINAASPTTSNASVGSLMSGGLHASQACLSLTHFCGFARASTHHDSVVALEASTIAAERAGLLPQPEMSILASGGCENVSLETRPSAEHECRTSTPMSLG